MNQSSTTKEIVLDVRNLVTEFSTPHGIGRAVNGVSFHVRHGETLGIVGESGCGKSITALSIMQLIPSPPGHVRSGTAYLDGKDLLRMNDSEIRKVRAKEISMIFQEPMTSLNPVLTIGYQIEETLRRHMVLTRKEARRRSVEMLELVQIPEPAMRSREYPHQLSGGLRQRAMIAMALACDPKVLIADEPTTALDVTVQAQLLRLIRGLQQKLGTAVVLITHDLGVVAETCQRVIVMYAGRKIEEATVEELFAHPKHPYTRGLLAAVPVLTVGTGVRAERLNEIRGVVPPITEKIHGCPFAPRCPRSTDRCENSEPELTLNGPNHHVACWHPENTDE